MDTSSTAYKLLSLIAISGECSVDALSLISTSKDYIKKIITKLKEDNYIRTHYKDRLRGYRLTKKAKTFLLSTNPKRFSFYLTGNSDTSKPRSDYPRRLRLHQTSVTYAFFLNAGITIYRDEKPLLFSSPSPTQVPLPLPVFYHSRELKELGVETTKINNSRSIGVLFTDKCFYTVFYTGDTLMKWEYRTELKVKTMLQYQITRGVLSKDYISPWYHPDTPIKALLLGTNMDTAYKLLTSNGGFQKCYFYLDTSFDYFHYLPVTHAGSIILTLLCNASLRMTLKKLLLSDMQPPYPEYGLEHDGIHDTLPLLLAFDFDMNRIRRFHTALSLHGYLGHLICFDFQQPVLMKLFQDRASIETIDLAKFERRFLP